MFFLSLAWLQHLEHAVQLQQFKGILRWLHHYCIIFPPPLTITSIKTMLQMKSIMLYYFSTSTAVWKCFHQPVWFTRSITQITTKTGIYSENVFMHKSSQIVSLIQVSSMFLIRCFHGITVQTIHWLINWQEHIWRPFAKRWILLVIFSWEKFKTFKGFVAFLCVRLLNILGSLNICLVILMTKWLIDYKRKEWLWMNC